MQGFNRVAESTNKEILVLEIRYPPELMSCTPLEVITNLQRITVTEMSPKRFNYSQKILWLRIQLKDDFLIVLRKNRCISITMSNCFMTKFKNYESFSMGRMLPSLLRNTSSSIFGTFIQVDFCAFTDEIRISVPSLQARSQCGILLSTLHHHQKTAGFAAITESSHHFCALFHFSALSHYLWDEHFFFYFAQWFVFRITYKKKCCWKKNRIKCWTSDAHLCHEVPRRICVAQSLIDRLPLFWTEHFASIDSRELQNGSHSTSEWAYNLKQSVNKIWLKWKWILWNPFWNVWYLPYRFSISNLEISLISD